MIKCQIGQIVSVDLASPYWVLTGTTSAFFNLYNLVNLTLVGNGFSGSIFLDVSFNNISGQIPKFSSKVKVITKGNMIYLAEIFMNN